MRLELSFQNLKTRLREPRFEFGSRQLALAVFAVISDRLIDTQNRPVNRDAEMQVDEQENFVNIGKRRRLIAPQVAELRQDESVNRELKERDDKTYDEMRRKTDFPAAFFKRKSSAEPQNERRQQKPDVAGKQLPRKNSPE